MNFVTLAMTPTALVGVNKDLKVPKSFSVQMNAKPSTYAYPEMMKKEEGKSKEKVETAVLSTTAKVKARKDRKDGPADVEMQDSETSAKKETEKTDETKDEKMDVDAGETDKKEG